MGSQTIWSLDERKARFGMLLSANRLTILLEKRIRHLMKQLEKKGLEYRRHVERSRLKLDFLLAIRKRS